MKNKPDLTVCPFTPAQVEWLKHYLEAIKENRTYSHIVHQENLIRNVLLDEGSIHILEDLIGLAEEQLSERNQN